MDRRLNHFNWIIVIFTLIINCLGLATLLSISQSLFIQQLIMTVIALCLYWFFSKLDFSIYHYLATPMYVVCILFLLITFLGPNVRGATRWLEIGGIRLQPSEIVKPFLILSWITYLIKYPPVKLKNIIINLGLFILPWFLVLRQPDLGNAIIFGIIWSVIIILSGLPWVYIISGFLAGIVVMPIGYNLLHNYQKLRILIFLNPTLDPKGAGYNAIQAMIAVGSGGWFGRGFGRGTQSLLKFLPEYHTDFIFASFAEQFGFIGGFLLIVLYFVLLWKILSQAKKSILHQRIFIFIVSMFTLIFIQMVINIGMNLGLMPITGITLPFMSLGGSSLISLWIGLGIMTAALNQKSDLMV